jgi:tetratricopeptide (TPR) repeat protein
MASGKARKAYKKWVTLPDYVRYSKSNQLLGIVLAGEQKRKTFFSAYIEFTEHFPEEPGKYIIPLNGLIKYGFYQAALNMIDKLEEAVKNDPVLNIYRAEIYYKLGDVQRAEESLNTLIEELPDFETGYISLLGLYLNESSYGKATELLDKIMLTFDTTKEDLHHLYVNHPDFINSIEYRNWMDR